jgi:type IV pilus assembly protein PilB
MKGDGCDNCGGGGFRGRRAIFEMMQMNSEIRELAFNLAPVSELRRAALSSGMRPLVQDGRLKVLNGVTTPAEIAVVAQVDLDNVADDDHAVVGKK